MSAKSSITTAYILIALGLVVKHSWLPELKDWVSAAPHTFHTPTQAQTAASNQPAGSTVHANGDNQPQTEASNTPVLR